MFITIILYKRNVFEYVHTYIWIRFYAFALLILCKTCHIQEPLFIFCSTPLEYRVYYYRNIENWSLNDNAKHKRLCIIIRSTNEQNNAVTSIQLQMSKSFHHHTRICISLICGFTRIAIMYCHGTFVFVFESLS